jgi:MinD superfamily P-loop ATPase
MMNLAQYRMTEITVLSGKGGTGKTSISAAFATIEMPLVVADCDVDAANLHLLLTPDNFHHETFITGHKAIINNNKCTLCEVCIDLCRFNAITLKNGRIHISETSCDGCKLCAKLCPENAIDMQPSNKSQWFMANYRNGKMVHARLAPGEENSGKLVNVVRNKAKQAAKDALIETIIIDGPPGTGCPVISSMTGAKLAVIVTEPTRSGLHDLKRILELAASFSINSSVLINKYDLNLNMSAQIEQWCKQTQIPIIGKLAFDEEVVKAMLNCKSIIEWQPNSSTSKELREIWQKIKLLTA